MKKIDQKIKEAQSTTEIALSFLTDQSFVAYKDDYLTQGKILDSLKQAKEKCYDLGEEIVQQHGWKKPETLEELFYLLQEQAVIDSDLVDQMIAMYRVRPDLIIKSMEKNDLKLVDEILRQNLADINLYLKQVKEYTSSREITEFRNMTKFKKNEYK